MNLEFSSQEELFDRVKPALSAKVSELKRLGFSYISETDIWDYLIESKWKSDHNLMLSDIVNDILQADNNVLNQFVSGKFEDLSNS